MARYGKQKGFTITELMIAITLGMTLIGSILLGYLATYTSSLNTLANSRLNQELSTLMSIMVNDIRRAGYNGETPAILPTTNPFNTENTTTLRVIDSESSNTPVSATGSGQCLTYAYNVNFPDTNVDANELLGFRLFNNQVDIRTVGDPADPQTCVDDSNNDWLAITDSDFITIASMTINGVTVPGLEFDLSASECLNASEPDGTDSANDGGNTVVDDANEYDCYLVAPKTDDISVETRELTITLSGYLTEDPFVRMSISQNVRIRNEYVRIR